VDGAGDARHQRVGWALVAAQFVLIGLCVLPVGPVLGTGQLRPLGLVALVLAVVVGGLAVLAMGTDTRVHPVPGQSAMLRTNGVYAVIRHPMYAAVLLACLGVTLSTGRVLSIVSCVVLMAVLHIKARFEDRLLAGRFGPQYAAYAARVPAIIPQPWRSHAR
jgi:protein-S-isoprenylcysteine O-methyltransferase Ste14